MQLAAAAPVEQRERMTMFTSINPATGEAVATFEAFGAEEVELALKRADTAFKAWRTSSLDKRTELLAAIADQLEANKQHLAETATREMGKTLASAIAEIEKCASAFRHYARHGPSFLEPVHTKTSTGHAVEHWLPIGPVLAIMRAGR